MNTKTVLLVAATVALLTCGIVWAMEQHQILNLREELNRWGRENLK